MRILHRISGVVRSLAGRGPVQRELDEEVDGYFDMLVEENVARGMGPDEARRRAQLDMGGVEQVKESVRAARPGALLESLVQDVRLSVRRLRREPTFALAVALTLSLGIGASTAVFGILSATLLSRIPYREADRLVIGGSTSERYPGPELGFVSGLDYYDYRDSNRSLDDLAAFLPFSMPSTVTGRGNPWEVDSGAVTWNLLRVLGTRPAAGRFFRPEEEAQADTRVVVISYGLWQRRFGGDPGAMGGTLVLDGAPHTIVGVLPRGFRFVGVADRPGRPTNADVWLVVTRPGQARHLHNYHLVGRLKPGVSMAQAQQDVDAISRTLERQYPDSNQGKGLRLESLQAYVAGGVRAGLLVPTAATACLLLVACANVAGLMLARGQRRTGEIAMRSALGASRRRLVRQQLTESMVLTAPAGLLGVGVAYVLQGFLLHLLPMDPLNVTRPVVDAAVLTFALGVSLATGLLVGLVPAVRGAAANLLPHLGAGRQASGCAQGARLRGLLVAAQIAVSVVLLVGAGLVARSLVRLSAVDFGFSTGRLISARVEIQASAYRNRAGRQAFFSSVLDEIRALPNVQSVGATTHLPILDPGNTWPTRTPERPVRSIEQMEHTHLRRVSAGYFAAMGIPLVSGRAIAETDRDGAPAVAVLSESLARRLYPDADPIGRTVLLFDGLSRPSRDIPYQIVGVVRSARLSGPREDADPAMYLSILQASPGALRIVVRTAGDPAAAVAPIREIVRRHDRNALVADVRTMDDVVDGAFVDFQRVVCYLGLFAGAALLLSALGLYGALAYYVSQLEHEIGVRIAIGSTRGAVLGLVLRRGGWLVIAGLILGLAAAYPGTRLVRNLLFETAPLDPVSYFGAVLALGLVALVACLVPALRATRVDPAVALRSE